MMASWPTRYSENGNVSGAHGHGTERSPVGSRMPLGCWQAFSSGVALCSTSTRKRQKMLVLLVPCVKSNIPGPSVVPAAKESPIAALQSCPMYAPVRGSVTLRPGIFTLVCAWSTGPEIASEAASYSSMDLSNWFRPMISHDSNMSFPGPNAEHCSLLPLQVEWLVSQGNPLSRQRGPAVLGDTSPRFVAANAATKLPWP